MKKIWKRVCTGILALTTILTALPITSVQAAETQYWTESSERVGYIEHVMNDGTIHSTFNEGHMRVEGETAYCVDINTGFKNGYGRDSVNSWAGSAIMSELHILRFHRIFRMKCMQEREHLYRQTKVAINVADISILVKDRILDSFGQN